MGFVEIKEWLDKQIAWRNEGIALKCLNSRIKALDIHFGERRELHCWNVDVVADILGIELQKEYLNEEYDRVYFMYEGYKVFDLKEKTCLTT